ncbi:MAG: DUF349 domain-containing protein [Bacteroidia bacterium]|nr:DUF349 domain-containing protein [Bacteroidia bacterium]MDW8235071.1 DUF349 domain-containing protein [Bacteroidia bacterium]
MVESQTPEGMQQQVSLDEDLRSTLSEIINLSRSPESLRAWINEKRPQLQEVTILLEYLAQYPYTRKYNAVVQAFRRYVSQKLSEWRSSLEKTSPRDIELWDKLQKRFDDVVLKLEGMRQQYESKCKENAEKARALLQELKEIVHGEQLDKERRVRTIAKEWRELREELLPSDEKELKPSFYGYIKQFRELYARYRDFIEAEHNQILKQREQLLQEIQKLFPPDGAQTGTEFWQQHRDKLALLQQEWQSLPRVYGKAELEMLRQYRALVNRFKELYSLFRSQTYQRIQKNPILQETYRRKRQIVETLRPLVTQQFRSLEEWKQTQQQVRSYIKEWRTLTEKSLTQDDSREVRRFYAPLNQQFSELLDTFHEKSEGFSQEYRRKQIQRLTETGRKLIQEVQQLLSRDLTEAIKRYRAQATPWRHRAKRFLREAPIAEIHSELHQLWSRLKLQYQAYLEKLKENLEKRIYLLNQLDELGENASADKLQEFIQKLIEYERAGEVASAQKERLQIRQNQAIQRFLKKAGIDEATFQDTWLSMQIAQQSPQQVRKSVESLKAQLNRYRQDLQGYQNTMSLLSRSKGSEALRQELEQKIQNTQAQIARTQEMLKRLQQRLSSANAPSSSST